MTEVNLEQLGLTVGIVSAITTATTYVIVIKAKDSLKTDFCDELEKIKNSINKIKVRLGIVEHEHAQE